MKKILIPIDFSDYAEKAFDTALMLADDKAEIYLLHSYFDPLLDTETEMDILSVDMDATQKVIHQIEIQATSDIENLTVKLKAKLDEVGKSGISLYSELKKGIPEDIIVMMADELKADLIIMGTKGLDGTSRFLLGSVTASVINHANIPVLAIPEDSKSTSINKILYATDFDEADVDALSKLAFTFQHKPVSIHCVHICVDTYKSDVEVLMEDLKQDIEYGKYEGNINFELLEADSLEKGIEEYIDAHNIDIVAMTTHKRNFFSRLFNPSHTKKLLYHTHTPLLAFHA